MYIVIFHSSDVNQPLRTNITLSSPPSRTLSMLMLAMFISQRNTCYMHLLLVIWVWELLLGCQSCCFDPEELALQRDIWCSNGGPWTASNCSEFESTSME